ncbi:hypothetical protein J2X31_003578 [Flavobacterium arsenatis]|uniref:DUF3828 domain-containing protein n=1 Tax=Flavobacterium arsenatis TaxID=1484332 RepID=A0ABU1TUI1_9FLAO|nr:hypothetical protein [Flavobacterium arsenatis]MDR6969545.1 hypothetical protein [Flavobacterium arsenatis]
MKNLLLIPLIFLTSCNSKEEKTNTEKPVENIENQIEKEPVDELKTIEQNGKSFYDWYFKNDFPNCDIVKDKNGKCLVDTVSYFKTLRSLGTISEKFIRQENERLQGCAEFISTIDYSEFESADVYEYDEYCVDLYYYYWLKSQEHPNGFSARNIKKINDNKASLDIYQNYNGQDDATPLSTVILEKEKNTWKITEIKFLNREETPAKKVDILGKWENSRVDFRVGETSLIYFYHGQCAYDYPIKKINETEFEMIWAKEMDCVFDNGVNETFGLKKVPEIGKPFAKYTLKNNILYAEYYYKEWVEKYSKQIQNEVFADKYFRRNEN